MSVFHIGIDDDGKDCWTDTPTLWIGATGSGKSSRFVARSAQKAREQGDCQIVDVGGETDLLTGERIARALSHTELQAHAANLMEEALFMTPVSTPVILDEPRSVEGDYERWVKEIVFSAEKKRPIGIALQTIAGEGFDSFCKNLHHFTIVCLVSRDTPFIGSQQIADMTVKFPQADLPLPYCLVSKPAKDRERKWVIRRCPDIVPEQVAPEPAP